MSVIDFLCNENRFGKINKIPAGYKGNFVLKKQLDDEGFIWSALCRYRGKIEINDFLIFVHTVMHNTDNLSLAPVYSEDVTMISVVNKVKQINENEYMIVINIKDARNKYKKYMKFSSKINRFLRRFKC